METLQHGHLILSAFLNIHEASRDKMFVLRPHNAYRCSERPAAASLTPINAQPAMQHHDAAQDALLSVHECPGVASREHSQTR